MIQGVAEPRGNNYCPSQNKMEMEQMGVNSRITQRGCMFKVTHKRRLAKPNGSRSLK